MKGNQAAFLVMMTLVCGVVIMPLTTGHADMPRGAKTIFNSGEGSPVRTSSGNPAQSVPAKEKYIGIAYKIVLLKPNGNFSVIPRTRTFKSGERIKLLVRTNQAGYLTIMNIGSDGNTTVLFDDYVEARQLYEIPKSAALKFAGGPSTEKIMIMLSGGPNPIARRSAPVSGGPVSDPPPPQAPSVATAPPDGSISSVPTGMPPPSAGPVADASSSLPPPQPIMVASNMQGSKDIVVEDLNKTGYAVIFPKTGWKPSAKGTKDIVLENDARDGSNYGVVPVSAIDEGGILTLDLKLTHR